MIEFRTTTALKEAPDLLPLIEKLIARIDPHIVLRTETHRRTMLIRIDFPAEGELEIFLGALQERGIRLYKTGVMTSIALND